MQEYNSIDYRKNPISDKEKELNEWLAEELRFNQLPQTTNKQNLEVLDNFKQSESYNNLKTESLQQANNLNDKA